jgi:CRP/FNR family transcriptional regulator
MIGNDSIYNTIWSRIFTGCPTTTFKKQSVIIESGTLINKVFFIKKGKVKFSIITPDGNEKTIYSLNKGGIFGDIPSIAGHSFYLTATAVSSCTLCYMEPQDFLKVLLSNSSTAVEWIGNQSEIIEYLVEHITDIAFLHKESLVCKYIYRLSLNYGVQTDEGIKIQTKITHQLLAELIGCSRVTVSKIMSKLLKNKIIDKKKGYFYITDLKELERCIG